MKEPQHNNLPDLIPDTSKGSHIPEILDLLLEVRIPSNVDMTSDGKRVAVVVWECMPGERKHRSRIWATGAAEGEARPFISGKSDQSCPRWSPDGKYLAFITKPEGEKEQPQLHLMGAEGGQPKLVCTMPNGVSELAWAPSGKCITFLSLEGKEPESDPQVVGPTRHTRLWSIDLEQAIPEPVTAPNLTVREYAWSPDSKHLALYYSTGSDLTDWYHSQIGVVPAHGGAVQQLTHLTLPARALAWSQDCQQIAYISGRWSDPGRGAGDIFALSLKDHQVRNLTPGIACSPSWCCWLPDNRHLLYNSVKQVTHQISLLDTVDGRSTVLEKDFVMQSDLPWLAITPDQRYCATIHSTSKQPPDVWSGKLNYIGNLPDAIEWKRLSRLNPLLEEIVNFAQTERISYASVDGWQIDGLFTPALTTPEGQLPPVYVEIHGGPSGAYCDHWFLNTSFFIAHGFAVFRPNMRGSWGHGAAFADAVLGDMGGKDFQDILNGIEYLVKQKKIDGNRVCIGGWSNGGFLSAWAVTQTDRFRAAMVGAGISDWHNMHAQTNIPDADILLMAANPYEKPEVYYQHSPMTYVERIATPALILHGEDDPAVPVAQAYAFYRALYERHIPVECVIYPREGHGLSEIEHRRDSLLRQLRWFEHYTR